ncbi:MAG: flagellar biosynthetic protein FliO [Syntrophomonadaceae bacterium]|nr:flagellar biosynthetic protein FliO [Syntrophomonadaceae bacterium]MDD3890048.1 flagellar biosynthetic protein FliO [Syntrophomonadaceae bacterium]
MLSLRRKYLVVLLVLIITIHIFPVMTIAADMDSLNATLAEQEVDNTRSYNLWVEFIKLLVVLAIIIGAAWSVIRIFNNKATSKMQGNWLYIVDEVLLGQNRGIALCKVGEKLYALGVTDHNISVLFEIDNPELLEEISASSNVVMDESKISTFSPIKSKLNNILRPGPKSPPLKSNFHTLISEQLQKLEQISANKQSDSDASRRRGDENDQK